MRLVEIISCGVGLGGMSVFVAFFPSSANASVLVLSKDDEIVFIESWRDPLVLPSL